MLLKCLNLLLEQLLVQTFKSFFILSSSATVSTGFTDLFDQINFDSEFLSLFRGVPFFVT